MVFGGFSSYCSKAIQLEKYLIGKQFDEKTLVQGLEMLNLDRNLDFPLETIKDKAAYKKSLISQSSTC
jgi:xanthine dehydrogenase iron-sulfur cluster and FAD-binding subunit A